MNVVCCRFADLGVKQIGGSGTNSLNNSQASLQVNQFMGDERPPSAQRETPPPQQQAPPPNHGYSNVGYQPTQQYQPEQPRFAPPQQYQPEQSRFAAPQQQYAYQPPAGTDTSV